MGKTIYHVITTSGENYNEVTINWHSELDNSFVLIKSYHDANYEKMMPNNTELWSTKEIKNAFKEDSFATKSRYVCSLELNNLSDNEEYIYKIVNEKEESSEYKFKISKEKEFSFIALCDLQQPYNKDSHKLINKLKDINKEARLIICSGDLITTAAYEKEWDWLFDSDESYNDITFSSTVGDHEYWGENTGHGIPMLNRPETFNHLLNNPKNGCRGYLNTTYYILRNDTLIVFLDMADSNTNYGDIFDKQVEWFKDIVSKIKHKHLIVVGHKSLYGSLIVDSSVAKYIKPLWTKEFDKANVDLVISGHDHLYSRSKRIYEGIASTNKGTYYLDIGSSGTKRRVLDGSTDDSLHDKVIDIRSLELTLGAIITINDEAIIVNVYDKEGIVHDSFKIAI